MPIVCSAAFDTVIGGTDYRVAGKLTVNLPAGAYVDFTRALSSVSLTAAMTSPLPDDARTQGGLEAVSADFTIAGSVDPSGNELITAADLFNPDNPDSPLYHLDIRGCSVYWEQGVYVPGTKDPETPRVLTGWITSFDIDWDQQTVTLHVIDLDPDWDDTPRIPAVVTAEPFNAGLTTEYAMDALIRKTKGVSTWPAQRPGCVLAAGMRSSIWPEVGRLDTNLSTAPLFVPGVFGSAATMSPDVATTGYDETVYTTSDAMGADIYFESWISADGSAGGLVAWFGNGVTSGPTSQGFLLTATTTAVSVKVLNNGVAGTFTFPVGVELPLTGAYIGLKLHQAAGSATWNATLTIDGTSYASGSQTSSDVRQADTYDSVTIHRIATSAIEAIQVSNEAAPVSNFGFTPIAVLDPSLNPLTVVPAIAADTKSWDEMQTMAAAECGFVFRDGNGVIQFRNRRTLLGQTPSDPITSYTSLETLATSVPPTNAYRTVNVTYTEWDYSNPRLVWSLTGNAKKFLAAGKVTTWTQKITDGTLIAQVDGTASILPNAATPGASGASTYRASLDPDGINPHPGLRSLTIEQLTATSFRITADLRSRPHAYLVSPSTYSDIDVGTPSLWIGGIQVTSGDAATVTVSYGDGKNPLDFGDNPYLQDHDTALALGNYVLAQVAFSVRDFPTLDIVPDPRIMCGDIKPLTDAKVAKISEYVQVWGYTFTADFPPPGQTGGTWTQTLDPRAFGPPDAWLGGAIPDRAEVDSSWAYS